MDTQQCSRCKMVKPHKDFSPSRRGKNGYPCKLCVSKESAERRADYPNEGSFRCGKCGLVLSAEAFSPSRRANGAQCKSCNNQYMRDRREAKPYEALAVRCARYGLTTTDFIAMLAAQGGCCKICGTKGGMSLHIDHCEETGKVRGLLCGTCNRGIGLFYHDPHRLESAKAYLVETEIM